MQLKPCMSGARLTTLSHSNVARNIRETLCKPIVDHTDSSACKAQGLKELRLRVPNPGQPGFAAEIECQVALVIGLA